MVFLRRILICSYEFLDIARTIGPETRVFTLTYDANGNMTHISQSATFTDTFYNITEMEFQFDEKNRMTHYRFGGSGSYHQIKYDAIGRVRERVNLTPTTSKYYSDGRQLIQQLDNSDNVEFDYFRGPTGLMRQVDVDDSNKKRFYIKDPLGTVLALVNPSDLSVTHYNYNAWGEHLDKDDTDFPTDTNLMRYIGSRVEAFGDSTAQTDAIYHLDHRHYLPVVGIFLQRDPYLLSEQNARFPLVLNPYIYGFNSSSNLNDPKGLSPSCFGCGGSLTQDDNGLTSKYSPMQQTYSADDIRGRCCRTTNRWMFDLIVNRGYSIGDAAKTPNPSTGSHPWWTQYRYLEVRNIKAGLKTINCTFRVYFHMQGFECRKKIFEVCPIISKEKCYNDGWAPMPAGGRTDDSSWYSRDSTPDKLILQTPTGLPFTYSMQYVELDSDRTGSGYYQDCADYFDGGKRAFCRIIYCPCQTGSWANVLYDFFTLAKDVLERDPLGFLKDFWEIGSRDDPLDPPDQGAGMPGYGI